MISDWKVPRNIHGLYLLLLVQIISFGYEDYLLDSIVSTAALLWCVAWTSLDCCCLIQQHQTRNATVLSCRRPFQLYIDEFVKMEMHSAGFSGSVLAISFVCEKVKYLCEVGDDGAGAADGVDGSASTEQWHFSNWDLLQREWVSALLFVLGVIHHSINPPSSQCGSLTFALIHTVVLMVKL